MASEETPRVEADGLIKEEPNPIVDTVTTLDQTLQYSSQDVSGADNAADSALNQTMEHSVSRLENGTQPANVEAVLPGQAETISSLPSEETGFSTLTAPAVEGNVSSVLTTPEDGTREDNDFVMLAAVADEPARETIGSSMSTLQAEGLVEESRPEVPMVPADSIVEETMSEISMAPADKLAEESVSSILTSAADDHPGKTVSKMSMAPVESIGETASLISTAPVEHLVQEFLPLMAAAPVDGPVDKSMSVMPTVLADGPIEETVSAMPTVPADGISEETMSAMPIEPADGLGEVTMSETTTEPADGLGDVTMFAISTEPADGSGGENVLLTTAPADGLGEQLQLDDQQNAQNELGHISVDTGDDTDSAFGSFGSNQSSTMSVRSSVYDVVEENGRTYHRFKEGNYIMPNDEIEQDRLDMQHKLCLMTLDGKLHLAPIKKDPHHVLDIGTGTGIWAIEFAVEHPSAVVIGNDLSPIQPQFVPPNCRFEVDDVEDEWIFGQKFDFIHGRLMVTCFKGEEGTRKVFQQAFNALTPGGYFEMQDGEFPMISDDGTLEGTALWEWNELMMAGGAKAGRPWTRTKMYAMWMVEAGFEDVTEIIKAWPINTWPRDPHLKKIGLWFREDMLEALSSTKAMLTRVHGWTSEQAEAFLVNVRRDYMNRNIHAYTYFRIVYGRKPE